MAGSDDPSWCWSRSKFRRCGRREPPRARRGAARSARTSFRGSGACSWDGALQDDAEILALLKTTRAALPSLEARIAELHPYDAPEVVALEPAHVEARYLARRSGAASDRPVRRAPRRPGGRWRARAQRPSRAASRSASSRGALFLALLFWPGLDPLQRRVAATTALSASIWLTVAIPVGAAKSIPAMLFPRLGVMPAKEVAPIYLRRPRDALPGRLRRRPGPRAPGGASADRALRRPDDRLLAPPAGARLHGGVGVPLHVDQQHGDDAPDAAGRGAVLARADEEDGAGRADPRFAWCLLRGSRVRILGGRDGDPVARLRTRCSSASSRIDSRRAPSSPSASGSCASRRCRCCSSRSPGLLTRVVYRFTDPRSEGAAEAVAEERAALEPMSTPRSAGWRPSSRPRRCSGSSARRPSRVDRRPWMVAPAARPRSGGRGVVRPAQERHQRRDGRDPHGGAAVRAALGRARRGRRPLEEAGHRYLIFGGLPRNSPGRSSSSSAAASLAQGFKVSGLDAVIGGTVGPLIEGLPVVRLERGRPRGALRQPAHRGDVQHRDDRRAAASDGRRGRPGRRWTCSWS